MLPILKANVTTINDLNEYENDEEIKIYSLCTRIYSYCWRANQINDFYENGYLLHRINHSVWLGSGLFHTNTVEGLWAQIKRLCNNFAGINFHLLDNLANNGISPKEYLDDWICWGIFLRECEMNKLY